MHRILFHIGNYPVYSYGVMIVIAYFLGLWIVKRETNRSGLDSAEAENISFVLVICGVLGARIWYVWEHWIDYAPHPYDAFKVWEGGLVFYGGAIAAIIGTYIYIKWKKIPFLRMGDAFAPGLALAIGVGRIGCFLNGCCYGKLTHSWIGVKYPVGHYPYYPPAYIQQLKDGLISHTATHSLPVIPTQPISTVDLLVIFGILMYLRKRKPFSGFLLYLFLLLYGVHRFFIDFFRYYEGNATILKYITLSQLISLIIIVFSVVMLIYLWKKRKRV